eukprot:jgi/Chlat1/2503/Chrsp175S08716
MHSYNHSYTSVRCRYCAQVFTESYKKTIERCKLTRLMKPLHEELQPLCAASAGASEEDSGEDARVLDTMKQEQQPLCAGATADNSAAAEDHALRQSAVDLRLNVNQQATVLVECKLGPSVPVQLLEAIRNCAPVANDISAASVISYAKEALDMVKEEEKSKSYKYKHGARALLFRWDSKDQLAADLSDEDVALAAGVAQLFRVYMRVYRLTNFHNAKSVVFAGDTARAHAAAYAYGAIYIAKYHARNEWSTQEERRLFANVGGVRMYYDLATCSKKWTVEVLKDITGSDSLLGIMNGTNAFWWTSFNTLDSFDNLTAVCNFPPRLKTSFVE